MHLELSSDEVELLRAVLETRLHDLEIEINRTDSLEYKDKLRRSARVVDRVLAQLASSPPAAS